MHRKGFLRMAVVGIGVVFLILGSLVSRSSASEKVTLTKGQTVYVPVYSHILVGDRELPFAMSANLSVRNTDPANPITVVSVDYYVWDKI